jgi:hypothetical protein
MAVLKPQRPFKFLEKIASCLGWSSEPPAASAPLPLPEPETAADGMLTPFDALAGQLRGHGADLAPRGPEDARLLASAGFLIGEHRAAIAPLLDLILSRNGGEPIRLDLKQHPAAEIGVICQFAQALARLGLLADYTYRRAPHYLLTATVQDCPAGRRFLAGGWFPYYARAAVLRRLGQPRPPHALDVRLELPKGPAVDLDLLALCAGRLVCVCFGCENLTETLGDLRRVREALPALDPRLFLVLPRVNTQDVSALAACFEVTVCDREDLELLLEQLQAPPAPEPPVIPPACIRSAVF